MLLGKPLPPAVQDVALLAARLLLGTVLIAHGWQKASELGVDAVADGFDAMGIPAPLAAAWFATVVELGGGVLLLLGLLTPLAGLLVALDMTGAWWFAHREAGVFAAEGGWELVAVIGAGALVVAALGAGRLSADQALFGRRRPAPAVA